MVRGADRVYRALLKKPLEGTKGKGIPPTIIETQHVTILSAQRTTSKVSIVMEMFFAPNMKIPKAFMVSGADRLYTALSKKQLGGTKGREFSQTTLETQQM